MLAGGPMAAGVIYNEAVDGDLEYRVNPLLTLNFGLGTNTVSGHGTQGSIIDFDSFAFVVPGGTALTSASLQMTFSGGMETSEWVFLSGSNVPLGGAELYLVGSIGGFTSIPLAPGMYQLYSHSYGGSPNLDGAVDYVFTFDVTVPGGGEVPEPGSMTLLGGGLAAMAWRLRRR